MSEQIEESGHSASSSSSPLESYIAYPFASDETYQNVPDGRDLIKQGMESLIAGGAIVDNLTPEEKEETLRRIRVFYFNRATGNALSVEEVRMYETSKKPAQHPEWEDQHAEGEEKAATTSDEARALTFAELQELIESGKVDQIPNNKVIPERLNEAPPSQSNAPFRKKPWEVAAEN
ncbi:hypothetical protein C0995_013455 [Termitomyces sp. Mi166|nr:hypothetical protein C0995_013455 [Termitomyces sp. Mi166\